MAKLISNIEVYKYKDNAQVHRNLQSEPEFYNRNLQLEPTRIFFFQL